MNDPFGKLLRSKIATRRAVRLSCVVLLLFLASVSALADTTLADYQERLEHAHGIVVVLFDDDEEDPTDAQVVEALESVRKLMHATEDVTFFNQKIHIDNGWMIESLDSLISRYRDQVGTAEARYSDLVEISGRIALLCERVGVATEEQTVNSQQAKLESILARAEYQPELRQESGAQRWLSRVWNSFMQFLTKFIPAPPNKPPDVGGGSLDTVRIVIALGLLAALIFGVVRLVKRMRIRRYKSGKDDGVRAREVLGEAIAEDATAQDLLARAAALATQGDYRAAIRLTFIALLVELEGRGKLRLDRAKTNYDYVNEIRPDPLLFGPVAAMTSEFEKVWYGQHSASNEDYTEFVSEFGKLSGRAS